MSNPNIADATGKVFQLLEPLEATDRRKVIDAVLTLFGDKPMKNESDSSKPGRRKHRWQPWFI
jgi:hypothetical protein